MKEIALAIINKLNWKIAAVWSVLALVLAGVLKTSDLIEFGKFIIGKVV